MLKGANIEGEDEEEEKIQDMEGLSRLFLGLFSNHWEFRLVRPRGIIPAYPPYLKIVLSVYKHQEFQFPLLDAAHCGTESEHQVSNGNLNGMFSFFILSPFTRILELCTK